MYFLELKNKITEFNNSESYSWLQTAEKRISELEHAWKKMQTYAQSKIRIKIDEVGGGEGYEMQLIDLLYK